jgi:hypothetical protein
MIPPSLFLFYLFKNDGIFEDYCSFCFITSFILGIGGIICTWLVPDDYNLGQVRDREKRHPPSSATDLPALFSKSSSLTPHPPSQHPVSVVQVMTDANCLVSFCRAGAERVDAVL